MRKSWKPSERDPSSGLQRLVGDFVNEDHLFIDLMIKHLVQSLGSQFLRVINTFDTIGSLVS